MGDTVFAVEHTGVRKRQREGTLKRAVKYDKEALEKAYAWMTSSSSDSEDDYSTLIVLFFPPTWTDVFAPQVYWF